MSRGIARFVPCAVVAVMLATMFASAPGTSAAVQSVDAWIEIGATSPAVGCTIGVSIEVRSSGHAVSSTEVSIALFEDETLVSADRSVTNSEGVAHLAVETGGATGSGWLDINVAGAYLVGEFIGLGDGSSCSDGYEFITASGDVPAVTVAEEIDGASAGSDGVFVGGVPFYVQQRNLSCEYAALYIATAAYGNGISEYAFDEVVGWSPNPHWGYRGDITGWWGNTTDYGVYAEPLAWALPQFGFQGEVFYSGGDTSYLMSKIDADVPVVVWLALWGDQSVILEADGVPFMVTAGMHVVVAYGYDDYGVWVSDPAIGGARHYSWSDFTYMWGVMDGMALAVYQA